MKKVFSLFVSLALLSLLAFAFVGCGEEEKDIIGPEGGGDGITSGFEGLKAGSWSELVYTDGTRSKYEFLGTDTYKGVECYLLEFETIQGGTKNISQIWINKSTGQGVLMVMKDEDGVVMKMEMTPTKPQDIPTGETPVNSVKVGTKKYTTPTGKTVEATVYKTTTPDGEDETWISLQVPFWEVKSLLNGKVLYELYDFGTSGAKRDISKEEMENAISFGLPG